MISEFQNKNCAPYVGPRPFERRHWDRFCARTHEVNEAFSLIIAHPMLLIYAQSGAGKTSLINAGLRPLLEQEKLDVLPVARVYGKIPEEYQIDETANPYVLNTLISWASEDEEVERLKRLSLTRFLSAQCPLLCVDDVKDPVQLAGKLQRDSDLLTRHLRDHLSDITQRLLSQGNGPTQPSDRLQQAIVDDLNHALKGPPLYSEERFAGKTLAPETLALTSHRLRGPQLGCLNRRLLDAAFPNEIQPFTFQEEEAPAYYEELPSHRVAFVDQFEELFTSYPERWCDRESFIQQVGDALEWDPLLRVVFVMREEHIAQLDPYLPILPERLRTRLRIERLGKDMARQAIEEPLEKLKTERSFAPGVADVLVEQLLKVKVFGSVRQAMDVDGQYVEQKQPQLARPRPWDRLPARLGLKTVKRDEAVVEIEGPHVEPVQLQVVCSRLWDKLETHEKIITQDHLDEFGDVTEALLEFYERGIKLTVQAAGAGDGQQDTWWMSWTQGPMWLVQKLHSIIRERRLRAWFGRELITPWGTRSTVVQGPERTGRIPNDMVETLDSFHLVRWEKRAGGRWYELTHDRFIDSIVESNKRWRDKWVQRIGTLSAATLATVALMVVVALSLKTQTTSNLQAAATAQAQSIRLAQQAATVRDSQFDLALLLSLEASRGGDSAGALLEMLQRNPMLATFLHGHRDPIKEATFSPDGQVLASVDRGGSIILWDVAERREQGRLEFNNSSAGSVLSVAFSPDGQRLASGGCGTLDSVTGSCVAGDIRLWNLATGQEDRTLGELAQQISSVAFSPDSKTLASGGCAESDPEAGTCIQGEIRLWDVATGQESARVGTHTNEVVILTFSPDGQKLVSGGADGTIALWDAQSGLQLAGPDIGSAVWSVAFSPDGHILALGDADGRITLWDANTSQPLADPLSGHVDAVNGIAFSLNGRFLASGAADGTAVLWDMTTGEPFGDPLGGHRGAVNVVAFSPDGGRLATGGDDSKIILWDVAGGSQLGVPLPGSQAAVRSVDFSPDGELLAWSSDDGGIILWDIANSREFNRLFDEDLTPVPSLDFSRRAPRGIFARIARGSGLGPRARKPGQADNQTLVSGAADGTIVLWDVPPLDRTSETVLERPLRQPEAGTPVWSIALSMDGKRLASGGCGSIDRATGRCVAGEIRLWDVNEGEMISTFQGHANEVWAVAFSPDGRTLASGGCAGFDPEVDSCKLGEILVWDVAKGELLSAFYGHSKEVGALAFSPDGHTLASGGCGDVTPGSVRCASGQIRLWDVGTGETIAFLHGHTDETLSVAFSPDGRTLVSTSADGSINLWDVRTSKMLGSLSASGSDVGWPVWSAAFSPDGQTIATGNDLGAVTLWDVSDESWRRQACRVANRNMTRTEWIKYVPDRPHACTCPNLPCQAADSEPPDEPQDQATNPLDGT